MKHLDVRRVDRQLTHNIFLNFGSRRRRERDGGWIADLFTELGQASVVRPKVVAPLANAMCLVNNEELDISLRNDFLKFWLAKSLGRNVEQTILALRHTRVTSFTFMALQRRVNESCINAFCDQRIDLVFHQGNQRRKHQHEVLVGRRSIRPIDHSGNLIAK